MGKVGSIFRDARLGKGLTLDQVADETNISKRFLQGIESDSYDGFPGEVYALGFIRNYADFLDLDARKMIERYHSVDAPPQASPEASEPHEASPSPEHAEAAHTIEPISTQPMAEEKEQTPSLFAEEDVTPPTEEAPPVKKAQSRKKPQKKQREPDASTTAQAAKSPSQGDDQSLPRNTPALEEARAQVPEPAPPLENKDSDFARHSEPIKSIKKSRVQLGRFVPLALVAIVIAIAAVSILPMLNFRAKPARKPVEYRAEGLPFELRLYTQDKVFLPLGNDFVSVTLSSIKDKITFDTPFGALSVGLNDDVVINPSSESERLTASILDYVPNEPQNGVRVRFDTKAALSSSDQPGDITVAADGQKSQGPQASSSLVGQADNNPELLFRSSGGAHPFYVNVSFMAPVLFRYEADKKEWVEKYYRKGESITVNASNSITFWTANAQAVKVNVFQSAGKSTELVMGGAGEIAVKRLFWSNAQGGWAVVADSLD